MLRPDPGHWLPVRTPQDILDPPVLAEMRGYKRSWKPETPQATMISVIAGAFVLHGPRLTHPKAPLSFVNALCGNPFDSRREGRFQNWKYTNSCASEVNVRASTIPAPATIPAAADGEKLNRRRERGFND